MDKEVKKLFEIASIRHIECLISADRAESAGRHNTALLERAFAYAYFIIAKELHNLHIKDGKFNALVDSQTQVGLMHNALLNNMGDEDIKAGDIRVCPSCGYVILGELPRVCPCCGERSDNFIAF